MNKRYMALALIPIIALSSVLGVYAYLVSMQINTTVTVSGFDAILYNFSDYLHYSGQIVLTDMISADGYDNAFGLVVVDQNMVPSTLTVSVLDMPDGGSASAVLIYTSWRVDPLELYYLGDPIPLTLDVPLAINPDYIDFVTFENLWVGPWVSSQESQNSAIIVFTFDMTGVTNGIWGDIPITINVDLSS